MILIEYTTQGDITYYRQKFKKKKKKATHEHTDGQVLKIIWSRKKYQALRGILVSWHLNTTGLEYHTET